VFSVFISSVPPLGVANASPEIAMLRRAPAQELFSLSRPSLQTEVPPVPLVPVDPVETIPLKELEEPALDEAELLDPLLEEESFEDLSLEPLSSEERDLVEEEPVGEEALAVRSPLKSPEPSYPRAAYLRKLEGTVVLIMIVNSEGIVTEVEMIQSSGHRLLDRAALVAARGYRFEAGEESMTVNKTFTFKLH
jgi:protein TonB